VSDDLSALNDEHVRQIGRIIDVLERSTFDFLQVEVGELKVTIGKGDIPVPAAALPPAQPVATAPPAVMPQSIPAAAQAVPAVQQAHLPASGHQGSAEIKAPIMGMFYAQPEPGAPPFVAVGSDVREDTTVALVEVMKTFNAVTAGVRGRIVEVCVRNAELVEFGQVLFRVAPE
jgi:acetyl-CoA carboxylase biotin carboxyl carrier protein